MKEHVIINKDRTVTVPESIKRVGIQYDHNVNKITFDCPRYADDNESIDLSRMTIYIVFMLPNKTSDFMLAENITVDETDSTIMHFDWRITNKVTPLSGVLSTLICIKQTDSEGLELYHWNTDLIQRFTVGVGMECDEQTIVDQDPEVITQILISLNTTNTRINDVEDRVDELENGFGTTNGLVTELKGDLSQLRNTGDNPAPAGKVWTSTDVGAGFAEPKKQPVPNKLTFIGAATGEFDGSNSLTINIPSGGDVWELVADVTLTEPTDGFTITKWPDGTNLALKKYVAFVDGIPTGTYNGGIKFTAETASSYNLFLRYVKYPDSEQEYSFVEYEALGNIAYHTTSGTVNKNSLGYACQNEVSTYNYDTTVADNFTVNRIGIKVYGGFEYPIGTKIKVYGVRA